MFIGETDERTVKEKYLMNITVKKEQKLGGINMGISDSYIKGIMKEIYREKARNKGVIVDQNMVKIIDKFKKEQKVLEDYKKSLNLLKSYNSPKKANYKGMRVYHPNFGKGTLMSVEDDDKCVVYFECIKTKPQNECRRDRKVYIFT